jgi:hypothetical protein
MYAYDVHPRLTLVSFVVVFNTRVPTGDRTELYVLKAGENEFHLKHIVPLYAVPLLLLPACLSLSLSHTHTSSLFATASARNSRTVTEATW